MKLWRLTRAAHVALDGRGAELQGSRYGPDGVPLVSLASEAALAVLITLRYQPLDPGLGHDDHLLGWTEVAATPLRVPQFTNEPDIRAWVAAWVTRQGSLLAALPSKVLPEADVVLLNPRHPDAADVPPLTTRPFSFTECLHRPPMLDRYNGLAT